MASPIRKKQRLNEKEDRISSLPNELIHHILSFLDTQLAVRTSVLSRRWKLIWTTLPFVIFDEVNRYFPDKVFTKFTRSVFSRRNHHSNISKMKLCVRTGFPEDDLNEQVEYAISHGVQDLYVETYNCDLSIFKSNSLKQFELAMNFDNLPGSMVLEDLPALTSLHLMQEYYHVTPSQYDIPQPPSMIGLASLKNLCLDGFTLPDSFNFPALTTLYLKDCKFPKKIWNLPWLQTLKLEDVDIPLDISDFFSVLGSLQSLTLLCCFEPVKDCLISCPQLLYLELKMIMRATTTVTPNIVILAPKLRSITTAGIFTITRGFSELQNASVKLHGCLENKFATPWGILKQYYYRLVLMFAGLGSTKILTLDSKAIEVTSY